MLSQLEHILLFVSFVGLTMGIGASISRQDAITVLQSRKPLLTGWGLQHFLLPCIASLFIAFFALPPMIGGTLLLLACCPGGATSNVFSYFAKGVLSLNIFLNLSSTICAFFMTPFLLNLFGSQLAQSGSLIIPMKSLIGTLLLALIPVSLGFLIRLKSDTWAMRVETIGTKIAYLCITLMVLIWGPKMLDIIQKQDLKVFGVAALLSFSAILCAFGIGKLLGLSTPVSRTLGFETAIKNAPLAFAILTLNTPKEIALQIGWIPLVYGALSVGNAALITVGFRLWDRKNPQLNLTEAQA